MALTARRVNGTRIPPLSGNSEFAAAEKTLAVLRGKLRGIDIRLRLLRLERYLASRSGQISGRDADLPQQIAQLRAELATLEPAPSPGQAATGGNSDPVIAAALALVRDGKLPPQQPDGETELLRQQDMLATAAARQQVAVDDMRADFSARMAHHLREPHNELLRRFAAAAEELASASQALRDFDQELSGAGYQRRYDLLPLPPFRFPLLLGLPVDRSSEISRLRVWMKEMQVA